MGHEGESRKEGFREGMRQGLGVLSALKEAIEETIQQARERGDLSPERARQVMSDALHRAQEMAGGARERLDFVARREFEALRERVEALHRRMDAAGFPEAPREGTGSGGAAPDPDPGRDPGPGS